MLDQAFPVQPTANLKKAIGQGCSYDKLPLAAGALDTMILIYVGHYLSNVHGWLGVYQSYAAAG